MKKAIFSWSGGKDSAFALSAVKKSRSYNISALLTTVTEGYDRVSMHGVRSQLLRAQARSLGYPLKEVLIPKRSSNRSYEARMRKTLTGCLKTGTRSVIFGDIFLEDLKKYREEKLSELGMKAVFPIWKRDTASLAREFIYGGFKAIITCVDSDCLDKSFAGRIFDIDFLNKLPKHVDPCGENGEFHSFVFDGPIFKNRIAFKVGDISLHSKKFYYRDLVA